MVSAHTESFQLKFARSLLLSYNRLGLAAGDFDGAFHDPVLIQGRSKDRDIKCFKAISAGLR